jgi:RNA polymerase sigma-70 factor (ECF subfamily)
MPGREDSRGDLRPVVYCLIPADLADELHALLSRWFRDQPSIEVVVERRASERRADARTVGGDRRVADRRALVLSTAAPLLPRRARAFSDRLVFLERLEPSTQQKEDRDTARLVARIQTGEHQLFSDLYTRYFDRVYRYLRLVLADAHRAEDAAQQVFLSVLEALPRYERRRQPFRAWLFVIARNRALSELRKQRLVELVDPVELGEGRAVELPDEPALGALRWISDRELLMLIERLPLVQQQVLMLRYALDLSHSETATVLGRSSEDVRIIQHRALQFLKARLVSLGREAPSRQSRRMRRVNKQATILRRRRFALLSR